jgi:murein DD-endopeptidase MepM/ murein hydrolase activator NlpD
MNYTSPTGVTNMYAQYENVTGVEDATRMFEDLMEGAGIPNMSARIEAAREILGELGGGGDAAGADAGGGGCTDEGGVASVNGFTFPLQTTKAVILAGNGGKWCHTSQTNCHHHYKAADIMVPTGTVVVAAKAGTVQKSSRSGSPGNVTINSSDGKGINFYQHMDASSVTVSAGQKVTAGQVLGKVGDVTDAFGTPAHLHFDMLPPQYKYRVSCASATCMSYPFIEVQPALTETFKLLP